MTITPENKIQQDAFNYFNNTYCLKHHSPRLLIHSVPNGIPVPMDKKERARALDLLKKAGMVNGISDLIIHGVNGRCLMAECKTDTGFQSDSQKEIESRIFVLGGRYFLFRSLLEFKQKINLNINWLLGK